MMKKYLFIFLVAMILKRVYSTDYTVYVDNSIYQTPIVDLPHQIVLIMIPSTFTCSGGSASAYNSLDDVDAFRGLTV
jgi:hypothetical protein